MLRLPRWMLAVAMALTACQAFQGKKAPPTAAQRRGAELYAQTCAVCHGAEGQGHAADQAPSLNNRTFLASVGDDLLKDAIARGRPGTTMSAWGSDHGGPLNPQDVNAVVAYIRSWSGGQRDYLLDQRPVSGNAAAGTAIFLKSCAQCHGATGVQGPEVHVGSAALLEKASNGFLRYAIENGRPGTSMPAFRGTLSDAEVEDLLAAMRQWQAENPRARAPTFPAPLPLGPVPLNPGGFEPGGFGRFPDMTPVEVVKAQYDLRARMAILDARAPSDYVQEHIAGAVDVPFYDPGPYLASLPKDAWLVCYCACPHAESGQLAQKLLAQGFSKVTVMDEGFRVWKERGYPTRSGREP